MVSSRRHLLEMDIVWIEFPTMDPWETSAIVHLYAFVVTNDFPIL
jgi:hypothetical protein